MSTKSTAKTRKRRFVEDSEDESQSASPLKPSPKKRRRRTLQLSQSDDDDTEKKQTKPKTKRKSKRTPKKAINRTPKPLKLTEAKPDRPLTESPSVPTNHNNQNGSSQDSTSSADKKVSSMKKKSPKKGSPKKKKNGAKSHDIRNFFQCSAGDFFSKFDKKPNYDNLKKQTSAVKNIQNGDKTHSESSEKEQKQTQQQQQANGHKNGSAKKPEIISIEDDDEDEDDVEMKDPSESNKPLKRRKKTPSPKKQDTSTSTKKTIPPSPGLTKTIQKLTCNLPTSSQEPSNPSIIHIDSNHDDNTDNKTTTDSKPIPISNGQNKNEKKTDSKPLQKKAGRKRKLDEISTGDSQEISTTDPPKKKAKKWYPGFKRTDAPPQHGQTEIPQGKPYCLSGMRFVITGQLPSLTRDECKDLILQYGGRATGSISGMTRYLIAGEDAGESKMEKARKKKVQIITETEFLDLIRTLPAGKAPKLKQPAKKKKNALTDIAAKRGATQRQQQQQQQQQVSKPQDNVLFVDKYKPRTSRDLIGNGQCIKSLREHLLGWDNIKNRQSGKGKNAIKRGVLLSGQPGIGKTSAVNVIAQELGFNTIEFNASDTRSKKSLRNVVQESLNNRTMTDFFAKKSENKKTMKDKQPKKKNLIIMDEVDGMSSGDRGGMQELVGYIQKSKVPIICICNDRHSPKVRTLSNYCLDLKFRKPTANQITSRLAMIARNEGFITDQPTIHKIAEGTNGDIRQMLHLLQFWSNDENMRKNLTFNEVKHRMENSNKDLTMGPWDVAPKLFHPSTSILKGIEYYFVDYSLIPLMVQENYLNLRKQGYGGKWTLNEFECISAASHSIADGDLIDSNIRKSQQYAALPYHGILSSLKPAKFSSNAGRMAGRMQFPQWLGKFSGRRKNDRLFSELAANINSSHDVHNCGVTPQVLVLDYMEMLKNQMVYPMKLRGNNGIDEVIEFMKTYNISREDWDTILSLGEFKKNKNDKGIVIPTKTKSAFTRKCKVELDAANKQNVGKKTQKKATMSDLKVKNEEEVLSESDDDNIDDVKDDDDDSKDITKDKLIKMTKGKKGGGTKSKKKTKTKTTKTKTKKKATTRKRKKKKTFDD